MIGTVTKRQEQSEDLAFADTAYGEVFETLGLEATRALPFNETIAREVDDVESMRELLPKLSLGSSGQRTTHFEMHDVLGRGGMGIVHLATQRALGRDVAVKTITGSSLSAEDALLQEARVMGMVEHPNVVPVHLIGEDGEGKPVVVMKRIEGRTWDAVLGDDELEDPLGYHLDILIDVCRALELAHDRGILHRDLKPANVMVGAFGEVYVLDWGLAVSLPGFDLPGIPRSADANHVVGTPHYIAPEMTVGQGEMLSAQTDIYLLGAVLHEVLTGRPPHSGKNLFEHLRSSYEGKPLEFDDDTPDELAAICRRAMARAPEERYPSMASFRGAIEEFVSHRSSHAVTAEATENLERLEALLASETVDEIEVYRVFGAARFGFEHAVSIWSENGRATDGLQETLETMIRHEIDRENLRAAQVLSVDLPRRVPALETALEALEQRLGERDEELRFLRNVYREYDTDLGIDVKGRLITMMGLAFAALAVIPTVIRATGGSVGYGLYLGLTGAFTPVMLAISVLGRETFKANVANRVMLMGLWLMYGAGLTVRVVTAARGLDLAPSIVFEQLIFATGVGMMTLLLYRRMAATAVCFFLGAITSAIWPQWALELYGGWGAAACFAFAAAVGLSDD